MPIVALDFETANSSRSSACALGVVVFDNHRIRYEWSTLINPEQEFSSFNIGIHGIRPEHVSNAPTVRKLVRTLWPVLQGATFVSHSSFDVGVIKAISEDAGLRPPNAIWMDSCRIARELWADLPNHKLKTVCQLLGYEFKHHDALEDARACSHIVRVAMKILQVDENNLQRTFGKPAKRT